MAKKEKDNFAEKILSEGDLCLHKKEKTLYVGLQDGDVYHSIRYDTLHISTEIKSISSKELELTAPEKIDDIYPKVLKPFFKTVTTIPASMNWIKCIEKFFSIEKLFMFVLTSKSKDYSPFMEFCGNNLDYIAWDTTDGDGNTMIHYATIMNSYPQVACKIISYVAISDKYKPLICQENNHGVVPLVFILMSKFGTKSKQLKEKTFLAAPEIIIEIINSNATVLKLEKDGSYSWKGGNEVMFGRLQSDPKIILLTTNSFKGKNKSNYRICCWVSEPGKCQFLSEKDIQIFKVKLNSLPAMTLEKILKFPCPQIFQSLFPNYVKFDSPIEAYSKLINFVLNSPFLSLSDLENIISTFKNDDWSRKDVNRNTMLHSVIEGDQDEKINLIIENCPEVQLKKMWRAKNEPDLKTPLDLVCEKDKLYPLELTLSRFTDFLMTHRDPEDNTLFHTATKIKSLNLLTLLLNNPLACNMVNTLNSQRKSPLMICVEEKFVEGIEILIDELNCETNISPNHGCDILHLAVIHYNGAIVSKILETIKNKSKSLGHSELLNKPIKIPHFSTETAKSIEKYTDLTPLLISMTLQHFDAARLLIEEGAEIDHSDPHNQTFFHFLIKDCREKDKLEDFFKIQLKPDNYKTTQTPFCPDLYLNEKLLYLSIELNNIVAFELLLPRSTVSMLAYQDSDSLNNVLHLALNSDSPILNQILEGIKCLKEVGSESGITDIINKRNKKGQTPLLLSVQKGNVDYVQCLLEFGCDVTDKYEQGTANILHYAVVQANTDISKSILLKIDEMNVRDELIEFRNKDNLTPLHLAVKKNNPGVLELLLSSEINIEKQSLTLLNYASEHGSSMHELISEKMKQKKNTQEKHETTPETEILIDPEWSTAKHQEHEEETAEVLGKRKYLKEIVSCETTDKIQEYLENTANLIDSAELSLIASQHGTPEVLNYLLEKEDDSTFSFDFTSITNYQNTVFHCAVTNPCKDVIKKILKMFDRKHKSKRNDTENKDEKLEDSLQQAINARNAQGRSALEGAIEIGNKEAFESLVQSDASFQTKDKHDNSILHHYMQCSGADPYFLEHIMEKVPQDFINSPNTDTHTPLHLAVMSGSETSFQAIIRSEACKYDALTSDGDSIVHLAAKSEDADFLNHVLEDVREKEKEKPEETKLVNLKNKKGSTPIFLAAEKGNVETFLNQPDVRIEGTGEEGKSLIHEILQKTDKPKAIEKILLRHEHLLNLKDASKQTPLFCAVINERTKALQLLLKQPSIDVTCQDIEGMTVLHHSIECKDEIFNPLFDKLVPGDHDGVILNVQDSNLKTILHHAIELQPFRLSRVEKILSSNPDLSLRDREENTPLILAVELEYVEVVDHLLQLGCDVSLKQRQTNILHIAFSIGNVDINSRLLDHINDATLFKDLISSENENGNTPLRIALHKNDPDLLRHILMIDEKVNNPTVEQ